MTSAGAGLRANGYLDQERLLERILGHIAQRTTDLASGTWREPVEHYRSPGRLAEEVELVLRRRPVPFCPSAALPGARSYLARDSAGVPVVAVRGRDGVARAFRNACRHRGAALVSGSGCAASLAGKAHRTSGASDARRDRDFVAVGAAEDLAVAVAVQHGFASGANEFLEFGRFEGAITHFHDQLHQALRNAGTELSTGAGGRR